MMLLQVGFVLLVVSFITIQLDAVLFDDYAGPYEIKDLIYQHCPYKGNSCGNVTYIFRRISREKRGEAMVNATIVSRLYVTDKVKLRVTASTRGPNGRFNSLLDFTQPICKWAKDWVSDFLYEVIADQYSYKITDICESWLPGVYDVTNFHFIMQKHLNFTQLAPILPYGRYKTELRISEAENPDCFCSRAFANVVPDANTILKKKKQMN